MGKTTPMVYDGEGNWLVPDVKTHRAKMPYWQPAVCRALLAVLVCFGCVAGAGLFRVLSDPCPDPEIGDPETAVLAKFGEPLLIRTRVPSEPDGWTYTSRHGVGRNLPAHNLPSIENKALWYPCRFGDYTVIYIDERGLVSDVLDGRS